jgi:hypothetical protein
MAGQSASLILGNLRPAPPKAAVTARKSYVGFQGLSGRALHMSSPPDMGDFHAPAFRHCLAPANAIAELRSEMTAKLLILLESNFGNFFGTRPDPEEKR